MWKMADYSEEEGVVGECSSQRINGVRRAVRELMREALQSEENSELIAELKGSRPSNTEHLLLLKEIRELVKEKRLLEIELELRKRLVEGQQIDTTLSQQELEERVESLESEVTSAKCRISQEQQLIQSLQCSEILTKHLFQRPDPTVEDRALKECVAEISEVGKKVGRVSGEVEEGEEELVKVKRERHKSMVHCREMWTQIKENERMAEEEEEKEDDEGSNRSEVISRLKEELEKKMTECRLLQGCLQGVIVGSGVDWSESNTLRDLTISLGQPFPWEHH